MIVNSIYLIPAIALLWIPRQFIKFKLSVGNRENKRKFTNPRMSREPGDNAYRPGEEFSKARNYVDFLRALAGSYGVMEFGLSYERQGASGAHATVLAIQTGLLVVAVLAQTVRWEGKVLLFAPTFYLTGIASGVCGIESAIYGTAAAWVVNAILPNPSSFLVVQAILIGAFGAFFYGPSDHMVVIAGVLTLIPCVIGFMLRRPLSIGTRHPFKAG